MTKRKPGRPPAICECGETAFARTSGPWTAIVDASDIAVIEKKWSADVDRAGMVYAHRTEAGKKVRLHLRISPAPNGMRTDHRDRNGLNCRRSNLRPATASQNQMNSAGRPSIRKCRFKGVVYRPERQKYTAAITVDGKRNFLGYFSIEEDAAKAYDAAAKTMHGEFAFLNFNEGELS